MSRKTFFIFCGFYFLLLTSDLFSISEAEKVIDSRLRKEYSSDIEKLNKDYSKINTIKSSFIHESNQKNNGVFYKKSPYIRVDYIIDERDLIFLSDKSNLYLYDKKLDQFNRISSKDTIIEILTDEKIISNKMIIQSFKKISDKQYSFSFFFLKKKNEGIINVYLDYNDMDCPIIKKLSVQKDINAKLNSISFYNQEVNKKIDDNLFNNKLIFKK